MGVIPYNSWCRKEAIEAFNGLFLAPVCVAVWVLLQYPLLQTWEHRMHHYLLQTVGKGWFMKPTSSERYTFLITIIIKGSNLLCLRAGVKELSWVLKSKCIHTADMDVAVGTVIVDLIKSK